MSVASSLESPPVLALALDDLEHELEPRSGERFIPDGLDPGVELVGLRMDVGMELRSPGHREGYPFRDDPAAGANVDKIPCM